jgi:group I intron endonuclease
MVIYITTNMINGRKYLGKDTKNDPNYLGSGVILKRAIKKYGKQNFKKEIIESCTNQDELGVREAYWLNYYDAGNNKMFYNWHNHSTGSPRGKKHPNYKKPLSEYARKKLSEFNSGKFLSEETRRKMSESQIGKKNHMFGKTHSDDARLKLRNANLGEKNPMFGKLHPDGVRSKMGRSNESNSQFKGFLLCVDGRYKGEIKTIKEWSVLLGRQVGHFSQHLSGKCYKKGINGNFFKRIDNSR